MVYQTRVESGENTLKHQHVFTTRKVYLQHVRRDYAQIKHKSTCHVQRQTTKADMYHGCIPRLPVINHCDKISLCRHTDDGRLRAYSITSMNSSSSWASRYLLLVNTRNDCSPYRSWAASKNDRSSEGLCSAVGR